MDRDEELLIVRRAYAKQVLAEGGAADRCVEAAFATVPRERYLGRGPWQILRRGRYVPTPSRNPVYLYADVLVGILPERFLNNGQPSFLATLISAAAPRSGDGRAVTRLYRRGDLPEERCWLRGPDWALAYD